MVKKGVEVMSKFIKKPVVIEATEWTGENIKEIMDFMGWRNAEHDKFTGLVIHTLEGNHHATIGDLIIKGVRGEFYPCKPDIFDLTYLPFTNDDPVKTIPNEADQGILDEGGLLVCLLLQMIMELGDRSRNEEDDEIIEKAMNWVEECTSVAAIMNLAEH
jgi:hypothetical protein